MSTYPLFYRMPAPETTAAELKDFSGHCYIGQVIIAHKMGFSWIIDGKWVSHPMPGIEKMIVVIMIYRRV